MKNLLDGLAYVILIGAKPLPLVLGGMVALLVVQSLEQSKGSLTGFLLALLLVTSLSLMLLPVFQWIGHWAERRRRQKDYSPSEALAAVLVGYLLAVLWMVLSAQHAD